MHSHALDVAAAEAERRYQSRSSIIFGGNASACRLYCCAATPLCSVYHKGLRQSSSVSLEETNKRNVQPSLVRGRGSQTSCDMAQRTDARMFDCTVVMIPDCFLIFSDVTPTGSSTAITRQEVRHLESVACIYIERIFGYSSTNEPTQLTQRYDFSFQEILRTPIEGCSSKYTYIEAAACGDMSVIHWAWLAYLSSCSPPCVPSS